MRGRLITVQPANPAAGAEWAQAVPANKRWLIRAVKFRLVTSATVGNRQIGLQLADAAAVVFARMFHALTGGTTGANQTAGVTEDYFLPPISPTAMLANGASPVITPNALPPGIELAAGFTIGSNCGGSLLAGDQFSAIVVLAEEWDA